jgi:hypothetical protein
MYALPTLVVSTLVIHIIYPLQLEARANDPGVSLAAVRPVCSTLYWWTVCGICLCAGKIQVLNKICICPPPRLSCLCSEQSLDISGSSLWCHASISVRSATQTSVKQSCSCLIDDFCLGLKKIVFPGIIISHCSLTLLDLQSILPSSKMPRRRKLFSDDDEDDPGTCSSDLATPLLSRDAPVGREQSSGKKGGSVIASAATLTTQSSSMSSLDNFEKTLLSGNLISEDDAMEATSTRRKKTLQAPKSSTSLPLFLVSIFGTACVASFGASFFLDPFLVIPGVLYAAAGFGAIVTGTSIVNEVRISSANTKRSIVNAMRDEINDITAENAGLEQSIDTMQNEIEKCVRFPDTVAFLLAAACCAGFHLMRPAYCFLLCF